jgi:hypothetical protein
MKLQIYLKVAVVFLVVLGAATLQRPSFKVLTELAFHSHTFHHHVDEESHGTHLHDCGCIDCPEEDSGHCHRMDCCDILSFAIRSAGAESHSEDHMHLLILRDVLPPTSLAATLSKQDSLNAPPP